MSHRDHTIARRTAALAVLVVLAVAPACSSDDSTDQFVEELVEQQGGDVEIDIDDGQIRVETSDGVVEMSTDDEGNVSIRSEDGDVQVDTRDGVSVIQTQEGQMTVGGTELPPDFPAEVPLPGVEIDNVSVLARVDGTTVYSFGGTTTATPAEAGEAYASALTSAGFTADEASSSADLVTLSFDDGTWAVTGQFSDGGDGTYGQFTVRPSGS